MRAHDTLIHILVFIAKHEAPKPWRRPDVILLIARTYDTTPIADADADALLEQIALHPQSRLARRVQTHVVRALAYTA